MGDGVGVLLHAMSRAHWFKIAEMSHEVEFAKSTKPNSCFAESSLPSLCVETAESSQPSWDAKSRLPTRCDQIDFSKSRKDTYIKLISRTNYAESGRQVDGAELSPRVEPAESNCQINVAE